MPKSCGSDCPLRPENASSAATQPVELLSHDALDQSVAAKKLYKPIKEWQTRVLIFKESDNNELRADLVTVDLIWAQGAVIHDTQKKIEYTALSYTWGAPVFSQRLYMNGTAYSITENLYQFLRRCLRETEIRRLWIDAVCINQHDNDEKSMQVANMLNIYRKASAVRVWLGEAGPHTDQAISYLRWDHGRRLKHSKACRDTIALVVKGLQDLYTRPYLSRIWIRQEVWSANKIRVMCGTRSTSWDRFGRTNAREILSDLIEQARDDSAHIAVEALVRLVESIPRRKVGELADAEPDSAVAPFIGGHRNELITAIRRSVSCDCTNPLDRIYGLLGMTKTKISGSNLTEDVLHLRVDYNRSMALVFEDVARYVMRRESSTSAILCLDGTFGGRDLPTWVPDWRQATSYKPFLYIEHLVAGKRLDVDDDEDEIKDLDRVPEPRLSDQRRIPAMLPRSTGNCLDGTLLLHGCIIGTVIGDAKPNVETQITLNYRDKQHPTRQFKEMLGFEDDSHPVNNIVDHLSSATEDVRARYQSRLLKSGECQLDVKIRGRKKPVILRSEDVEITRVDRLDAPVSDYSEHPSLFGPKPNESKPGRLKLVSIKAAEYTDVPLEEFLKSRYALQILKIDSKRQAKATKKEPQQQITKRGKRKAASPQSLPMRSKKNEDDDGDDDEDDDGDDDDDDDNDDDDDDDDSDDDEDSDDDDDDDSDEDDSDSSESRDSDDSQSVDSGDTVETDEVFSDGSLDASDPRDAFKHYSTADLNDLYNEYKCSELAAPTKSAAGDVVAVVEGSVLPIILRRATSKGAETPSYGYIGPALVSYRGTPRKQDAPQGWSYQLDQFFRPQRSVYAHWQALLQAKLKLGEETTFEVK